jgi:regulator of sigma E protease
MSTIVQILATIGIFAGALLILVFVHEFGHFITAKLFGMRVERFSLGFPPTIFRFPKGETEYCIGATPLGGYVKISGMIDESMDTDHLQEEPKSWEFRSKPVWQRMIVISAGVIFNMILAIFIYAGIGLVYGQQEIPVKNVAGLYIPDSSLAGQVGFRTGDKLLRVNGKHPKYFSGYFSPKQLTKETLSYTVVRNGHQVQLVMPDSLLDEIKNRGFIGPQNLLIPSKISAVQQGSPADSAGLKAGDKIVAINGKPVHSWQQMAHQIKAAHGALLLTIARDSSRLTRKVTPNKKNIIGIRAVSPSKVFGVEHIRYGALGALPFGFNQMKNKTIGIAQGFHKLFSGSISVRQNLGGPVAIANITRQATESAGWFGFWNITALLSITLAIMNILPIPVLDGGHLVFLFYELITRREPSAKVRMALQQIGFFIIIAIFVLVTFNDILRLF